MFICTVPSGKTPQIWMFQLSKGISICRSFLSKNDHTNVIILIQSATTSTVDICTCRKNLLVCKSWFGIAALAHLNASTFSVPSAKRDNM